MKFDTQSIIQSHWKLCLNSAIQITNQNGWLATSYNFSSIQGYYGSEISSQAISAIGGTIAPFFFFFPQITYALIYNIIFDCEYFEFTLGTHLHHVYSAGQSLAEEFDFRMNLVFVRHNENCIINIDNKNEAISSKEARINPRLLPTTCFETSTSTFEPGFASFRDS